MNPIFIFSREPLRDHFLRSILDIIHGIIRFRKKKRIIAPTIEHVDSNNFSGIVDFAVITADSAITRQISDNTNVKGIRAGNLSLIHSSTKFLISLFFFFSIFIFTSLNFVDLNIIIMIKNCQ